MSTSSRRPSKLKVLLGASVGTAVLSGLAAVAATRFAGRKVRGIHDATLDDPMDRPVGLTHHMIDIYDGASIHVVECGPPVPSGRPIVLLHGVTLQWWVWSSVIRLLRSKHRVLAWDMRGHGRSIAGTDGITLEAAAEDLAALLEELDVRDAIVVGHSMGGMVLGRFCLQHRDILDERVAGRVFLATSASSVSIKGLAGGLIAMTGHVTRVAKAGMRSTRLAYKWGDTNAAAAIIRPAFGDHPTARMVDDVRHMLSEVPPATLAQAGTTIAAHDITRELAAVDGPTLVIVGDRDNLTPPAHAKMLAGLIPGATLETFPSIGHQVMQEAPELLVESLERFEIRLGVTQASRS